ncbi:hypothetical protein [Paenibacillus aceti]|uniref:Uncharacterized protein n=1 Tax=Paenibacillus aceti TaxID=1820010 RepID=A0ABQ1VTE1_9BACL|nr:hypothetical protein [Paenibacillus aceti]GGF93858.1 hypothetical protein GCM10010913_14270 [Paenibacillus aceti]
MEKGKVFMPTVAALLAAIAGAVVWALIIVFAKYELGILAWGIGLLTAFAVSFFSPRITPVQQIIAVIASLIGIVLGKFFGISYILNDGMSGMFSGESITFFTENIIEMSAPMDILFIVLAVLTAWQLPARWAKKKAAENAADQNGNPATPAE